MTEDASDLLEKEIQDEEQEEEQAEEEIPESYTGVLDRDGVYVEGAESLVKRGYGFGERRGVLLPDVAAFHLQRRGILTVLDESGAEVTISSLLERGLARDPIFFLKYMVYRDMRSKGRIVKAGVAEFPFLLFYERPSRASSHIVAAYPRNESIPLAELDSLLALGGRYKKGIYLALVDEEAEVSYYEIKRFTTRPEEKKAPERCDVAQFVGSMNVVWDTDAALSLYREGYFGKPIGIRKPRAMEFKKPISLSFIESIYLMEKGRIRVEKDSRTMSLDELSGLAASEQNFSERLLVYRQLRDSGLIVKSGMKFGVDFAVYEYGPGLDHAPFLIHVYPKDSSITPTEIVRAGRLAASVKKKFIVAQVDVDREAIRMVSFARVKP